MEFNYLGTPRAQIEIEGKLFQETLGSHSANNEDWYCFFCEWLRLER